MWTTILVIIFILAFIGVGTALDDENYIWPIIASAGLLGFGWFKIGLVAMYAYVVANPEIVFGSIGLYLVIGLIVSFYKWIQKVRSINISYNNYKAEFLKGKKITEVEEALEDWINVLGYRFPRVFKDVTKDNYKEIAPCATRYKGQITAWITWWPGVVLWLIVDDFIVNLVNNMFEAFKGVYQYLSKKAFKA